MPGQWSASQAKAGSERRQSIRGLVDPEFLADTIDGDLVIVALVEAGNRDTADDTGASYADGEATACQHKIGIVEPASRQEVAASVLFSSTAR